MHRASQQPYVFHLKQTASHISGKPCRRGCKEEVGPRTATSHLTPIFPKLQSHAAMYRGSTYGVHLYRSTRREQEKKNKRSTSTTTFIPCRSRLSPALGTISAQFRFTHKQTSQPEPTRRRKRFSRIITTKSTSTKQVYIHITPPLRWKKLPSMAGPAKPSLLRNGYEP